jgi:hypothetical protein
MNNDTPLIDTLPTCIHEIVHMSQDILDVAGVKDSSGEVQAYIVERESARIMKEMYGIAITSRLPVKQVRKLVHVRSKQ